MFSRNLEKARDAFKMKSLEELRISHDAQGTEPHKNDKGQYIKSMIYGGLDGIITTFAVVAGVAGASLSSGIVLILGFANLIADGLSMAIGDYLSTKAENEYNKTERARELWEVENYPEGEKKELVEFYVSKGLEDQEATNVVDIISRHKKAWVDIMMVEELGIIESDESPLKNAIVTFGSFLLFGFIPLIIFIIAFLFPELEEKTFLIASVLTGAALFILGSLKVRITEKNWFISGSEMFFVGSLAAIAAYAIGYFLSGFNG